MPSLPVPTKSGVFDGAPGAVHAASPPAKKVAFFRALFAARTDVYAQRWEKVRSAASGWMPAVRGRWQKGVPARERSYLPLTDDVVAAHLSGHLELGRYPMLDGDRCAWLATDFDGPAAMLDALAYLNAARAASAPAALEVSRSGLGAHVWVFFSAPVPAASARAVSTGLLREAMALRGSMNLGSYDRLFPSQDVLQVTRLAQRFGRVPVGSSVSHLHAARATRISVHSASVVHARLGAMITVTGPDLSPALQATLQHAASLANPLFYQRQQRRASTWSVPRFLRSYDETITGDLVLPRGLLQHLGQLVGGAGSRMEVDDERSDGTSHELHLDASLYLDQRDALDALAAHDMSVLFAPPGAGKTVISGALIAVHGVSTLVLVDRKTLADQWRNQILDLIGVKAGQRGGGPTKTRGVIDIATFQTLSRSEDVTALTSGYGLVVNECHHVPAAAFEHVVRRIPARRWLGLTATPYRRDHLQELIAFQLGPVRAPDTVLLRRCRRPVGPRRNRCRLPGTGGGSGTQSADRR